MFNTDRYEDYMATKSVIKRSICLPKALDSYVVKLSKDKAKPMGKKPNYSDALASLIVSQRAEELKQAA